MDAPTITTINDSILRAAFIAPDNGGSAITHYILRNRIVGEVDWRPTITIAVPATSVNIINLRPGTEYEVQIAARNSVGDGVWSASGTGNTNEGDPVEVVRSTIIAGEDGKWYSIFSGENIGSFTGDMELSVVGDNVANIDRVWWTSNANNDIRINRLPASGEPGKYKR